MAGDSRKRNVISRLAAKIQASTCFPMFSGTRDQVYQLTFTGVHDFSVRRQVDRGAVINVVLSGGVLIELRLSGDGCLVENDWISFVAVPRASLGTFRFSFGSGSFSRGPVELPKLS